MPFIGQQPTTGAFIQLDSLTASATANYTLQLNGANFEPESVNNLLVSINGVIQGSNTMSLSGSTLTVGATLSSSDVIDFVRVFGNVGTISTPTDGSVTVNKLGTGAVTTAKINANAVTSAKMFSGFANGITELDQYRLTSDLTNNASNYITSNFERVDNAAFSKIGTGMSQSSGTFTFPSTGLYRIHVVAHIYIPSGNDGAAGVDTYFSDDDFSSTQQLATAWAGSTAGGQWYGTHSSECFVNVTNSSTNKIRFATNSMAAAILVGSTSINQTTFSFIRLGDSQ